VDAQRIKRAFHEGDGRGVRIAVIDSGVDGTHPAIAGRVRVQHDVVSDGYGVRCVPGALVDSIGHGTATAGIVAQIAPAAEIESIRVIGANAHGTAEQLLAGLSFAIERGFDVLNMSLGTTDERVWRRLSVLVDRAFYEGRIIVAAANNFGIAAFPAQLASVIGVDMAAFSDPETLHYRWNVPIEVEARGIYVEAPAMGGGTQLFTGTSFACPHVTGLVARLVSVFPGLSAFEARAMLAIVAEDGAGQVEGAASDAAPPS
jgi:subtilisin family serine protease